MRIFFSPVSRAVLQLAAFLILGVALPATLLGQTGEYEKLVAQAKSELRAGQSDQALADSNNAIALNPTGWEAHSVAGTVLQSQKHYDEATKEFSQALEYAPADQQANVRKNVDESLTYAGSEFLKHAEEIWRGVAVENEQDKSLLQGLPALRGAVPNSGGIVDRTRGYAEQQGAALSELAEKSSDDWVSMSGFIVSDRANTEGPAQKYLDGWKQRLTALQQLIQQFTPVLTASQHALASVAPSSGDPQSKVDAGALGDTIISLNKCSHSIDTIADQVREARYVVF